MSIPELLVQERHELIRSRLAADGRVIAGALAEELSVSEDTIRRDLREMAAAGYCKRVYGGAVKDETVQAGSILKRMAVQPERKDALARAAVGRFSAGMTLFIDAGSTNLAIARAIPDGMPLTVITNAPQVAAVLLEHRDVCVVVIGGQLDRSSGAVLGSRAMQDAERYHPDLCVLGSCGLDADNGVTASFLEEADFKRFIAEKSRAVMVAVTNDKLGIPAAFAVMPLGRCNHIVVEGDADATLLASFSVADAAITRARAP